MPDPPKRGRVLLLCQLFYPEMISTGMHMTELATRLVELGWEVEVVCAPPSVQHDSANQKVPRRMQYRGVTIHRIATVGSHRGNLLNRLIFAISFVVGATFWVLRSANSFRGIIVTTNPPFLGIVCRIAGLVRRLRYIIIVYDVYPDTVVRLGLLSKNSPLAWAWERISRLILRGAEAIVVIGRDMATIIGEKIGAALHHRIHLIPNWSDASIVHPVAKELNRFRAEQGLSSAFVVQYSGTMARIHNIEPLIEAAATLQEEGVVFQFIGTGAKKGSLVRMATELQLRNVTFLPPQATESLADVLSSADLSVVCLSEEFTGLSVPSKAYGIMAAGVPILGLLKANSEIGLTIAENDCGIVLPSATAKDVVQAIRALALDRCRLAEMGRNGHCAFRASYTLDQISVRYDSLLTKSFAD